MRYLILIFTFTLFLNAYSQSDDSSLFYPSDKLSLTKFFNQENRSFIIDTSTFFTNVNYNIQYGNAQSFGLKYKQELNSFFDLQLNLIKFSRDGLFQNEEIKNHEFDFIVNFSNKDSNYHSTFHYGSEKYLFEENGSVLGFNNQSTIDPILFSVSLDQANNTGLNRFFNYNQSFQLSEKLKLVNHSSYYSKYRIFEDSNPNLDYYSSIYIDSTHTFDSTHFSSFYNQLGFNTSYFNVRYLFKQQSSSQLLLDSVLVDHGFSLSSTQFIANYSINAYLDYYRSCAYNATLNVSNPDSSFRFLLASNEPLHSVFTNRYLSNHSEFNTNYSNYKKHLASIIFSNDKFHLSSALSFHDNYVFLNQDQLYSQNSDLFYHLKSYLSFNWKWRLLNASHSFTYQHSSDSDVFRVPQYTFLSNLYINPILFEESLNLKLGSSVSYFSSYYANAYSPSLATSYLQDNQSIGDFPFLSFYAKINIETVNVEFHILNLFDKLSDQTFYLIPNAPYYRSPFQLLISWQFD